MKVSLKSLEEDIKFGGSLHSQNVNVGEDEDDEGDDGDEYDDDEEEEEEEEEKDDEGRVNVARKRDELS